LLNSTQQQPSNYFELSQEEEPENPADGFGKISSPEIDELPDLPTKHAQLNRAHSSDHFVPTDLECFFAHLESRGRIGDMQDIRNKYSKHSKSELGRLPQGELQMLQEIIESFEPYTRKENLLVKKCLQELGLAQYSIRKY